MQARQVVTGEAAPHHGVAATVAQVRPDIRQELLRVGVEAALEFGCRVRVLGISGDGYTHVCSLPDCDLDLDAPEVIPPMAEVELAANGWTEPAGSVRLLLRSGSLRMSVLCVGWPESVFGRRYL